MKEYLFNQLCEILKSQATRKGNWVALEGIDGGGKSTLCADLAQDLRAIKSKEMREPLRSIVLSGQLRSPLANLYTILADRAEHVHYLKPKLDKGENVIADRSVLSTLVYQQDMGYLLLIMKETGYFTGPNLFVLLDLPASVAVNRYKASDRLEKVPVELMEERRSLYLRFAQALPELFLVVDATAPKEEVFQIVSTHLKDRLK